MQMFRDRIKEFRRVRAGDLRAHGRNWRRHPAAQREALRAVLAEVGYAGALLARELEDGSLELIDGHLRAETTPEQEVPVLVLDVNEAEAAKLLLTHDPLAAMAETNEAQLEALLGEFETDSPALEKMLEDLARDAGLVLEGEETGEEEVWVPELYQVLAECRDEAEQKRIFELLGREGVRCRVLTL